MEFSVRYDTYRSMASSPTITGARRKAIALLKKRHDLPYLSVVKTTAKGEQELATVSRYNPKMGNGVSKYIWTSNPRTTGKDGAWMIDAEGNLGRKLW